MRRGSARSAAGWAKYTQVVDTAELLDDVREGFGR
jgi:hypothetical protein